MLIAVTKTLMSLVRSKLLLLFISFADAALASLRGHNIEMNLVEAVLEVNCIHYCNMLQCCF